jgi:hypothetical protein
MALALVRESDGRVCTFLREDGAEDWRPPDGYTLIPVVALSDGWQWAESESPRAPQWVEFGAALSTDTAVNDLVATAARVAPVLHLMLGVGLGQAAQGDPTTFSVAWGMARAKGLINNNLLANMKALAANCGLPSEFIEGLTATIPTVTTP